MTKRFLAAGCAALVLVLAAASTGNARSSIHRTTFLSFTRSVGLPGVTLSPGTYTFELANPSSDQRTVVVRSADRQTLHYVGLTILTPRPRQLNGASGVVLGEAPNGTPPPITIWYPPDDAEGRQFLYPR